MKIFCEDFRMHFEEYCDGELPDEMREACGAHVKECARCHAFFYDHRRVDDMLGMLPREAAPEGFTDRVMARWREENLAAVPSLADRVREFFRSPRLVFLSEVAALAILVVGAYYFYNFHSPGGGTAASSDGAHSTGIVKLPKPTVTPATGTLTDAEKQRLEKLAGGHEGIANTVGAQGLIDIAESGAAPDKTGEIKIVATPVHEEMLVAESVTAGSEALAALSNFDQYFAAVSNGPVAPRAQGSAAEDLNFWGMHDIKKGLRDAAPERSTASPRIMLHKVFRAADYAGLTTTDMRQGVEAMFAEAGGRLVRAVSQTEASGQTVLQFSGWVPGEAYQGFQAAFVNWQPPRPEAEPRTAPLEVPGVTDTATPAAPEQAPANAVSVSVIYTFTR